MAGEINNLIKQIKADHLETMNRLRSMQQQAEQLKTRIKETGQVIDRLGTMVEEYGNQILQYAEDAGLDTDDLMSFPDPPEANDN
jgi:methyl-accepting chemotaxis protein